jgi:hypothetical protein
MTARIVEAERTSEHSPSRRFFIHSDSRPGTYWRVDYTPGESLTCSCPAGRRASTDVNARPCRHLRAVAERMLTSSGVTL